MSLHTFMYVRRPAQIGCELDSYESWVDSSTVGVNLQLVLVEIHAKGKQNARMN